MSMTRTRIDWADYLTHLVMGFLMTTKTKCMDIKAMSAGIAKIMMIMICWPTAMQAWLRFHWSKASSFYSMTNGIYRGLPFLLACSKIALPMAGDHSIATNTATGQPITSGAIKIEPIVRLPLFATRAPFESRCQFGLIFGQCQPTTPSSNLQCAKVGTHYLPPYNIDWIRIYPLYHKRGEV